MESLFQRRSATYTTAASPFSATQSRYHFVSRNEGSLLKLLDFTLRTCGCDRVTWQSAWDACARQVIPEIPRPVSPKEREGRDGAPLRYFQTEFNSQMVSETTLPPLPRA